MQSRTETESLMIRYLLGQLSEQEQLHIEKEFFTNEETMAQLLVVEDDLIDDYARGRLTTSEREQFEHFFLASPQRQQRVAFATAVAKNFAVTDQPGVVTEAETSLWQSLTAFCRLEQAGLKLAFASLALLITLAGAWLIFERVRLNQQLTVLRAAQTAAQQREKELQTSYERTQTKNEKLASQLAEQQKEIEQLQGEIAQRQQTISPSTIATLLLTPMLSRESDKTKRLQLTPHISQVKMQLQFEDSGDNQSYRANVRTVEGKEVLRRTNLRARNTATGKSVTVTLPASILNRADYILTLTGISQSGETDDVADFFFSIIR